jgi:hypothetical protein
MPIRKMRLRIFYFLYEYFYIFHRLALWRAFPALHPSNLSRIWLKNKRRVLPDLSVLEITLVI